MEAIKPPTAEEFAVIKTAHAMRFPDAAHVNLIGDGGAPVRLPLVLGNPLGTSAGAAAQTPGLPPASAAWGNFVGAMLKLVDAADGIEDTAAAECVLWPTAEVWRECVARWPALPGIVWRVVKQKCCVDRSIIAEVPLSGAPAEIVAAISTYPKASAQRYAPVKRDGQSHSLIGVIDAPDPVRWRFFIDGMRKKNADHWRLADDFARSLSRGFFREVTNTGARVELAPMVIDDVFGPWPGISVLTMLTASALAGIGAEAELGGF